MPCVLRPWAVPMWTHRESASSGRTSPNRPRQATKEHHTIAVFNNAPSNGRMQELNSALGMDKRACETTMEDRRDLFTAFCNWHQRRIGWTPFGQALRQNRPHQYQRRKVRCSQRHSGLGDAVDETRRLRKDVMAKVANLKRKVVLK